MTSARVFRIAVPMMFAFMSTPLLGMVDSAVVGRLGDPVLLGGIAVGALFFDFIYSVEGFLRSGTTGLTAQALGRGDRVEQAAVVRRALVVAVLSGLILILASPLLLRLGLWAVAPGANVAAAATDYFYARILSAPFTLINYAVLGHVLGQGRSGTGLALQTLLNGINMGLSIVFVAGLGWSTAGSGYAASLAEVISSLVGLWLVFGRGRHPQMTRAIIFNWQAFRAMMSVNRDIMIRTLALMVAFTLFTRAGARQGELVLAANSLLMHFFLLAGYFLDGFANAAEQLAGQAVGARNGHDFSRSVTLSLVWGYVVSALVGLLLLIFGAEILGLLTTSPEVLLTAGHYLPWAALTAITGVLAFGMDGVFIGATWARDMRNMMLVALGGFLLLLYALPLLWGNHGLWAALNGFLLLRGVSLTWRYFPQYAATFAKGTS